jgi:dihydrolipoamide dehydrogenase
LTKILADPETDRVLGVGIVGTGAGELIAEGALAIEMGALASDIELTIHPHPTLGETIMESAEIIFGTSTHYKTAAKQPAK